MKTTSITGLSFFMLFLVACSSHRETGAPAITQAPSIAAISPLTGGYSTIVSISGSHFGNKPECITVLFNDKKAPVYSLNDSLLVTAVPENAGSGVIEIIVGGKGITGPRFIYTSNWQTDDSFKPYGQPLSVQVASFLLNTVSKWASETPMFF